VPRKAGLMINYVKAEEIIINNIIDRPITIQNRDIKRITVFFSLGTTVSENGGATLDVSRIIRKS
jgi:hypothetical protein